MSNDNVYERLFKLQAMIGKLVLDGKRSPELVADHLQEVVSDSVKWKFAEVADLGLIEVPSDYNHAEQLYRFRVRQKISDWEALHYDDFPTPSHMLKPGDVLRVKVFGHWNWSTENSLFEQRMKFLAAQHAVHTGPQGFSLIVEQKIQHLVPGRFCCLFDKKERLLRRHQDHKVPAVWVGPDGRPHFRIVAADDFGGRDIFFCMTEVEKPKVV